MPLSDEALEKSHSAYKHQTGCLLSPRTRVLCQPGKVQNGGVLKFYITAAVRQLEDSVVEIIFVGLAGISLQADILGSSMEWLCGFAPIRFTRAECLDCQTFTIFRPHRRRLCRLPLTELSTLLGGWMPEEEGTQNAN